MLCRISPRNQTILIMYRKLVRVQIVLALSRIFFVTSYNKFGTFTKMENTIFVAMTAYVNVLADENRICFI